MNTLENFSELALAVRDLIRIGAVSKIDTKQGLCRVQTGEQVLILSLGGELDTPEVVCTYKLTGNISHSGGSLTSNGIALHTHKYGGVQTGGGQTQGPQ